VRRRDETPAERAKREAWERQCYGCLARDLDEAVASPLSGGPVMFAMSILSDAQMVIGTELNEGPVAEERAEQARQYMNRAKYIISKRLTMKETDNEPTA
jgi:hypothetical protein